jgi:hypothetical protein
LTKSRLFKHAKNHQQVKLVAERRHSRFHKF